jgi:hypothetical protein
LQIEFGYIHFDVHFETNTNTDIHITSFADTNDVG